jgi:hypothetical protein
MASVFSNASAGTITDSPLSSGATTINSAAFAFLPTIASPDYLYITVDPTGVAGLPEIVQVTAHSAAATSCAVVRGQQAVANLTSAGRSHLVGTIWRHSATKADLDDLPHRLLTTTGDTLYASAANTPARLAIGSNGSLKVATAGAPGWLAPGADGKNLKMVSGAPAWTADTTNTVIDAVGDLIVGTANDTAAKLPIGIGGQQLGIASGTPVWTFGNIYASAAARDAVITAPTEGAMAYLLDVNCLTIYSGAAWVTLGPVNGDGITYTPTWSGTLGNGSLTGQYWRIGRLITFRIVLIWGTTTSHASANQTFTAPVATDTGLGVQTHGARAEISCAAATYGGYSVSTNSTTLNVYLGATNFAITNTNPGTWAASSWIQITGSYHAAAD